MQAIDVAYEIAKIEESLNGLEMCLIVNVALTSVLFIFSGIVAFHFFKKE